MKSYALLLSFALAFGSTCAAVAQSGALPALPAADADKAALVEYQDKLVEWANKNAKDADDFWKQTNEGFYKTTLALLDKELDAEEKVRYNEQFAGILGQYALNEAFELGALKGDKLVELATKAGKAGSEYAQATRDGKASEEEIETLKKIYLGYARQLFSVRLQFALNRPEAERDDLFVGLVGDAVTFALQVPDFGEDAYNIVMTIRTYSQELGEEALDALCEAYEASENPKLIKPIQKTSGVRRYARLPGSELYFEALFPDEKGEFTKKFDPKEHEGKVYLVEVWATWCGPCRREIPRLKEVYERYHDAGFEIFGYSIDQDLDALKKFIKENEIPWPVASQKRSVEAGYKGLYEYYSINGVPEMILVDRDGKVYQVDCRGVKLSTALKELFPDVKPLDWKIEDDFSARDQAPGK